MYQSAGENLAGLGSHPQIARGQALLGSSRWFPQGEGMVCESPGVRVEAHSSGDVEKEEQELGSRERWSRGGMRQCGHNKGA